MTGVTGATGVTMRRLPRVAANLAVVALTVVTAASFCRVFAGWSFLGPLLAVGIGTHVAAAALRALHVPASAAVPLTLVFAALVVCWVHYPDTLWWGLPTLHTWELAQFDLSTAWNLVGEAIPPVPDEGGFGVAAAFAIGIVAALADAFAFRAHGRVEVVVPSGVVFVAVAAVGEDRGRIGVTVLWLVAALAAVALLRAAHALEAATWVGPRTGAAWVRWSAGGLSLAAVAGVVALALGPNVPGAGSEPWFDPDVSDSGVTEVVSPLVDIRGRLADRSPTVLFTVTAEQPSYWRLTGLSRFDGTRWGLPDRALDQAAGQLAQPGPAGVPVLQRFDVEALGGNLVPVAYAPTELRSASRDLFFVLDTGTLVVTGDGLESGDSYEIVSAVQRPTPEQLNAAGTTSPPDPVYLELPRSFTPDLEQWARDVTAGATTPYEQALALQSYFRTFEYDLEAPVGHSTSAIRDFLMRGSGYCEQFAGTYAAFARSLGLPSRVAVGFTQGERGGDGRYRVRSLNAHAWPEVWFDQFGWVAFEPTPGRGAPGAEGYTGVTPAQEERTPEETGATGTTVAPSPIGTAPAPDAGVTDDTTPTTVPEVAAGSGSGGGPGPAIRPWIVLTLVLLGAWWLLMPVVVRSIARRRAPLDDAVVQWRAATAALSLSGIEPLGGETLVEHARRAARVTGIDRREFHELATAATVELYSERPLDAPTRERVQLIGPHITASARMIVPWHRRALQRLDPRVVWELTGAPVSRDDDAG